MSTLTTNEFGVLNRLQCLIIPPGPKFRTFRFKPIKSQRLEGGYESNGRCDGETPLYYVALVVL